MEHALGRYDAYKDSGVEWLGEVPEHWTVLPLKELASKSNSSFVDGPFGSDLKSNEYTDTGVPLIQLNNIGIGFHSTKNLKFISEEKALSLSKHRAFSGEIAIAKMAEPVARATVISNVFAMYVIVADCIKFKPNSRIADNHFVAYALNTTFVKSQAEVLSKGTTRIRINLGTTKILKVVTPPLPEQKAIVDYLDTKTTQIDCKIDLLTHKATQYGKLKQSLINETVTRGLDKTVAMKDSGVDWLGDVPENWEVSKLSQAFNQIGSGTTPKSGADIYYEDGTTNWINTGDLNDGILYSCKKKVTDKALKDYSLTIYPAGSIIIAMYGATIGKVSVSMIDGCTNQACCVLNKSKVINIKFLFYWFLSTRDYIISLSYGGGQPNISQDTIKSLRLILPLIEEQKTIADYLDTKTAHIDRIIETTNVQIDKLKELRKTLINDVVTGKIKVA